MAGGAILMAAIAAALCMQYTCAVLQHEVGGNPGWDTGVDYKTWASTQRFTTGDTVVFKYSAVHNLVEVDKAGYDSCSAATAINSYSDGNTSIVLSKAGKRYFICGSPGHCNGGMKLEVDTRLASAAAPSIATAPASSPAASSRHHGHAHAPTATIRAYPSTSGAPEAITSSRGTATHTPTASVSSPKAQTGAAGSHSYGDVVKNFMVVGVAMVALVVL